MVSSWLEFWLELWLWPWLKGSLVGVGPGLFLVVVGQCFRTAAMVTAKSNFTHQIADKRKEEHVLVTDGVYR